MTFFRSFTGLFSGPSSAASRSDVRPAPARGAVRQHVADQISAAPGLTAYPVDGFVEDRIVVKHVGRGFVAVDGSEVGYDVEVQIAHEVNDVILAAAKAAGVPAEPNGEYVRVYAFGDESAETLQKYTRFAEALKQPDVPQRLDRIFRRHNIDRSAQTDTL